MRAWRRAEAIALVGAVLALLGDLGQLWTVNAARPGLGLGAPPAGLIVWATLLGAFGIPLYAFGYRAEARRLAGRPDAVLVGRAGVAFAVIGGSVHATTGVLVAENARGIVGASDPLQGILAAGPIVLALWAAAAVALLVAGLAHFRAAPRLADRLWNPLGLTLAAMALALLLPLPWRDFAAPAGVNVAHLLWFARGTLRSGLRPAARRR